MYHYHFPMFSVFVSFMEGGENFYTLEEAVEAYQYYDTKFDCDTYINSLTDYIPLNELAKLNPAKDDISWSYDGCDTVNIDRDIKDEDKPLVRKYVNELDISKKACKALVEHIMTSDDSVLFIRDIDCRANYKRQYERAVKTLVEVANIRMNEQK